MRNEAFNTILVVDDNPATLYSTSRVLRAANFIVREAASGAEALAQADINVGLVVLDVNLPDINGFEVLQRLRNREDTARTPVVHLSASFVNDVDKAYGLDAGADGYLTHPAEPRVLIATVRALLRTRRAEEEMRRSEAKFKAVFDRAPSGVALLDEHFVQVDVNDAACRLLNRPREDVLGHAIDDFISAPWQPQLQGIRHVLVTEGEWRGELPVQRPDGSELDLEWRINANALPGLHLAIVSDISERGRNEAERERLLASERAARSEAERANRLKDEFLATLSHELRNPLSSILGWAELLRRKFAGTVGLIDGLEAIERSARVQTQLISDLLDVSSIISGKFRLNIDIADPRGIIESAIDVVSAAARAKEIIIERSLPTQVDWISGDPARLQQIVWNLLTNAIKFTPVGGKVRVDLMQTGSAVEIVVSDNGRGIAPEFLPHVFDRFRQGDASTTKNAGGLGLGLSIVKHLSELHGGTVNAHSEGKDTGASFTVTLPVAPPQTAGSSPLQGAQADVSDDDQDLNGVRVLIVEDDAGARALVHRVLSEAGAEVAEADNVDDALLQLDSFKPALLISDIGMSPKDGYALIREIRARGYTFLDLPAVALTAFARMEDRRDALLAGYQMHLTKPVATQELLAAVGAFAGRGRLRK